MNKELIKKYKIEFDHWVNGGSVLMGKRNEFNSSIRWYPSVTNPFTELSDSIVVVINDEYIELRKALVEGKTIQIYTVVDQHPIDPKSDCYGWKDFNSFTPSSSFSYTIHNYRIKPEHEFKVGDWVVELCPDVDDYCKPKPSGRPKQIKEIKQGNTGLFYILDSDLYKREVHSQYILPWIPEPGEWCIMDSEPATDHYSFTVQKWESNSKWTPIPYTGPLPYFIKD